MATKAYGRHRPAADEIYCQMMAERTGEAPENYHARPFDADLLDYAPSAPDLDRARGDAFKMPWPQGVPIKQVFGPPPPGDYVPPGGHPDPRSVPGYPHIHRHGPDKVCNTCEPPL